MLLTRYANAAIPPVLSGDAAGLNMAYTTVECQQFHRFCRMLPDCRMPKLQVLMKHLPLHYYMLGDGHRRPVLL